MRVSELSRESGVPIATIKYYLREGLLHSGELTSATQARYDATHVARLRLVRALIGVGELSVATTKEVLTHLDRPPASTHDLFAEVHRLLNPPIEELDTEPARKLIEELGWELKIPDDQPVRRLAKALAAIEAADFPLEDEALVDYARAMETVAEDELEGVPAESREAAIRYVVLGTILVEPLLLALRRLAQINASARRYAAPDQ